MFNTVTARYSSPQGKFLTLQALAYSTPDDQTNRHAIHDEVVGDGPRISTPQIPRRLATSRYP